MGVSENFSNLNQPLVNMQNLQNLQNQMNMQNHIRQHQNSLTEKLYILDPTLRTALLELRRLVHGVSHYQLFNLALQETVTVDDFQDMQARRREDVTQMLRVFEDEVQRVLRQACEAEAR